MTERYIKPHVPERAGTYSRAESAWNDISDDLNTHITGSAPKPTELTAEAITALSSLEVLLDHMVVDQSVAIASENDKKDC